MKVKKSILKIVLRRIFNGLNKLDKNISKIKSNLKKKTKKVCKFGLKILNQYEEQTENIPSLKIEDYPKEKLEYYVDNFEEGLTLVDLDYVINMISNKVKEVKEEVKDELKDAIIDDCDGKRFIINRMIKSVYFKAKELIVSINGFVLRADEVYRNAIDKYLAVRNSILYNSYDMIKNNKFLLKFIIDNKIESDKEFEDCADILSKMYITEKDQNLYTTLKDYDVKFNNLAF